MIDSSLQQLPEQLLEKEVSSSYGNELLSANHELNIWSSPLSNTPLTEVQWLAFLNRHFLVLSPTWARPSGAQEV